MRGPMFLTPVARSLRIACIGLAIFTTDLMGVSPLTTTAEARGFARAGGGGYRAASRSTVVRGPAGGMAVSRTTARSGYNYGRATTLPAYRPDTVAGVARRTARRTTRRVAYGAGVANNYGYGSGYYYGAEVVTLPYGCVSIIFEGQSAYDCNGVTYIADYSSGQVVYYPIE